MYRLPSTAKYRDHATTAHRSVHRPQSSLRLGLSLYSGRGRFFCMFNESVSATRPIVAVIEADATDRSTLCSLLSSLDAEVKVYDSAESYLASRVGSLGCVITDVELPGMSGFDLLRLLRNARSAPPVILLGEESDVCSAVTAMREGAVDFIEKPHVDVSILRRVAYLLDHAQADVIH
jgi:FixJ family two-component response regulator